MLGDREEYVFYGNYLRRLIVGVLKYLDSHQNLKLHQYLAALVLTHFHIANFDANGQTV